MNAQRLNTRQIYWRCTYYQPIRWQGDINNAQSTQNKAENIMRQYGTAKVDYINILGIMSTIYSNAGNKQKAISLNSKVLEFYEKKGWLQEISHIAALNNQASTIHRISAIMPEQYNYTKNH
ncbi:MAG: tetratricopeptide repeat protein [Bacteroides uniformis]